MGSSSPPVAPPSPEFLAVFRAGADQRGAMTFARFMDLALYHPAVGYYRGAQRRIGYGGGTDFFTASTSGAIFGEIVVAACVTLLDQRDPRDYAFVEIGAETPGGILAGVTHPFRSTRAVAVGEPVALTGRCVVFSNELFDAQPFSRFVFGDGGWRELGVRINEGALEETEMIPAPENLANLASLPPAAPSGYRIDAPLASVSLLREIARQPWTGLFVAFDYGKSWRELTEFTPAGTARAYFRHTQSNDLLAQPGQQDLTCHVCWDWLVAALAAEGFMAPQVESQEAFLVHHAGDTLARIAETEAEKPSQRKCSLLQLLHPAHLGQKFQVLHASRG